MPLPKRYKALYYEQLINLANVISDDSKPRQMVWKKLYDQYRFWILAAGSAALFAGIITPFLINSYNQSAAGLVLAETPAKNLRWGVDMAQYHLQERPLRSGDALGPVLAEVGMPYPAVLKLVENCKGVFNINSLRAGRSLFFLHDAATDSLNRLVYEPSVYEYVVFNLREPYHVEVVKRAITTKVEAASGVLETSFWQALTDNGLSDELADGMIDVLASSVDFYHQRHGDRFKVVYEQHYVEGQRAGTGKILAALYEREGKQSYAIQFQKADGKIDYFDYEGRPARKAFLKAPVKFSRISSRYNLNRLHPVLGYRKAHFGTDYAAPHGTPIIAVAEGTVIEATRKGGNGIYVKIRHDNQYETQYLHMSGFAKGIRPGARVSQGQTIGYVGSTGLATGPHVCFRFWKNGRQVDHLRLDLPSPKPMDAQDLANYMPVRDSLIRMLETVPYNIYHPVAAEAEFSNAGDWSETYDWIMQP